MENLYVDFTLQNQKVRFDVVSRSHPELPLTFDYHPPLGDGQGFAGLEMLLVSFCGCVNTGVVALLRRAGKTILAYEGTATGIRQEKPLLLQKIIFSLRVKSPDIEAADLEQVLAAAATISPVWLAIKNNVEVETEFAISR